MASTSHQSAMRSFMVQTVCDKPLEQGRQDINVESTFYNVFMLSRWSSDNRLVRVQLSSSISAASVPYTVENEYTVIKDEIDAVRMLVIYSLIYVLQCIAYLFARAEYQTVH